MEPPVLNEVVNALFPEAEEGLALHWGLDPNGPQEWHKDLEVSENEFVKAVRKMGHNKAPRRTESRAKYPESEPWAS